MTAKQWLVCSSLAGFLLTATPGRASWLDTEESKLYADNPSLDDEFGVPLALFGDTLVVGAHADNASDAGSAYVFERSGISWIFRQRLKASDPTDKAHFGYSLAISGDSLVVGAPGNVFVPGSTADGAAYVFVRNGTTWIEQQKLVPSGGSAGTWFGSSVAIDGDTALVGAEHDDPAGSSDAGSAYVFVRAGTSWSEQQQLTAGDAQSQDELGSAAVLSGDTAIVGARGSQVGTYTGAGAAYVFERSGTAWVEQQKLTASDPSFNVFFGSSLGLSGDTLVVEATSGGTFHWSEGAAYIFVRAGTTWSLQAKLDNPNPLDSDNFGRAVAIFGDTVLVGAQLDSPEIAETSQGSVHVFNRQGATWSPQGQFWASDGEPLDYFGSAIVLSEDEAFVGAPRDDSAGPAAAGSVYFFALTQLEPTSYCTAGTSASGCQALLSATGTPSATVPSGFTLQASARRGPEGRPLLLRRERPAGEPVGQRYELPVRRAARRAHADYVRHWHHRPVRRLVHAGPQRALVPHVPETRQEPRRRGRGPGPALVPRPAEHQQPDHEPVGRDRVCRGAVSAGTNRQRSWE